MLCPKCGTINTEWETRCFHCGQLVHAPPDAKTRLLKIPVQAIRIVIYLAIAVVCAWAIYRYLPLLTTELTSDIGNPQPITLPALYDDYTSSELPFRLNFPQKWQIIEDIPKNSSIINSTVTFNRYTASQLQQNNSLKQESIKITLFSASGNNLQNWLKANNLDLSFYISNNLTVEQRNTWGRMTNGIVYTKKTGDSPLFKKAYFASSDYVVEITSNTDDYRPYERHINRMIGSFSFNTK